MYIALATLLLLTTSTPATFTWLNRLNPIT